MISTTIAIGIKFFMEKPIQNTSSHDLLWHAWIMKNTNKIFFSCNESGWILPQFVSQYGEQLRGGWMLHFLPQRGKWGNLWVPLSFFVPYIRNWCPCLFPQIHFDTDEERRRQKVNFWIANESSRLWDEATWIMRLRSRWPGARARNPSKLPPCRKRPGKKTV